MESVMKKIFERTTFARDVIQSARTVIASWETGEPFVNRLASVQVDLDLPRLVPLLALPGLPISPNFK